MWQVRRNKTYPMKQKLWRESLFRKARVRAIPSKTLFGASSKLTPALSVRPYFLENLQLRLCSHRIRVARVGGEV